MTKKIREIRIEGNIAYVPLTRGYEAIIDAEDAPLVAGYNWSAMRVTENHIYAIRNGKSGPRQVSILMHRAILDAPPGAEVDHIDGNGLNNRRRGESANLRLATHQENMRNCRLPKSNTSGLKGAYRSKNKWYACISVNGKNIHLGSHATAELAHAAYVAASAAFHGSFGRSS